MSDLSELTIEQLVVAMGYAVAHAMEADSMEETAVFEVQAEALKAEARRRDVECAHFAATVAGSKKWFGIGRWPTGDEAVEQLVEAIKWAIFKHRPKLDGWPEVAAAALARLHAPEGGDE